MNTGDTARRIEDLPCWRCQDPRCEDLRHALAQVGGIVDEAKFFSSLRAADRLLPDLIDADSAALESAGSAALESAGARGGAGTHRYSITQLPVSVAVQRRNFRNIPEHFGTIGNSGFQWRVGFRRSIKGF